MTQHSVARLEQLDNHTPLRVQAGSEEVILIRQGDLVHAYQAHCPHEGAPLDEGALCGGLLVCPWHKAAFAVDEGAVCEPPALADLRRYPVQVKTARSVDDQPLPRANPPRHSDARCFAVIGAGAAGSAAVATLLSHGFGGRLVWIDREQHPAYDRTSLSKFVIAGQMAPTKSPPCSSLKPCARAIWSAGTPRCGRWMSPSAKSCWPTASAWITTRPWWPPGQTQTPRPPRRPVAWHLLVALPGRRRTPARCRRTGPAGGHRRRRLYRPGGGFGPAQVRRASACGQPP